MLDSNVPNNFKFELLNLVPDAFADPDEYWRLVPQVEEGFAYSISSKRNLLISHSHVDRMHRKWPPKIMKVILDGTAYCTNIRRANSKLSIYIEHIRYEAFPELNEVKTFQDDIDDAIDVSYDGIEWHGRYKTLVHILPVSDYDMQQIRQFYPEDLPRELWAYVPETHRKYVVSSQGRGVILKRYSIDNRILKAQPWQLKSISSDKNEYYGCNLTVDGIELNSVSHQQILRSFIPKPKDDIYEVNHIDGDPKNNILDNLEWVTRQQNSDHYNHAPEMEYKRKIGYKKISEFGKLHQKEIQNRPEVNAKRSISVSKSWTSERKQKYHEWASENWKSSTEEQKQSRLSGLLKYKEALHEGNAGEN